MSTPQHVIPSKAKGLKDRIVGGAKEALGNLTGNEELATEGKEQSILGEREIAAARIPESVKEHRPGLGSIGLPGETWGGEAGASYIKSQGRNLIEEEEPK